MIEINLHEVIDESSNDWLYEWMGMNRPFSLEVLQEILAENNGNREAIRLNIHCDGGNVMEGLAIYDALRTSGRNIYTNVEGKCHSMAIVMLLAAPKGQRSAQPNSQFLIHEVSGGVQGNTTAVERYAEEMRELQDRILDIYEDRTGYDRAELEEIMKEEKFRDAEFMLSHGFISSINQYNTNQSTKMNLLESLRNLLNTAEKEQEQSNGAPVVDEQTKLAERLAETEKNLASANDALTAMKAENEGLKNAVTEKDARIAELEGQLAEAGGRNEADQTAIADLNARIAEKDAEIADLKTQVKSDYQPEERKNVPSSDGKDLKMSREEEKAAVREALGRQKK